MEADNSPQSSATFYSHRTGSMERDFMAVLDPRRIDHDRSAGQQPEQLVRGAQPPPYVPGAGAAVQPKPSAQDPYFVPDRMFVCNLPASAGEQALLQSLRVHFERFGPLSDVYVPMDRASGRPKGFGFITFTAPGTIDACLAASPHSINGASVSVQRAESREARRDSTHVRRGHDAPPLPRLPMGHAGDGAWRWITTGGAA